MLSALVRLFIWTAVLTATVSECQSEETGDNTEVIKSEFVKAAKKCSKLHSTTLMQAIALFSERDSNDHEGKCFLLCMLRQHHLMDKYGNYNKNKFEPLLSMLPVSQFVTSIQTNLQDCLEEDAIDPCEKAFRFLKCFYKKAITKVDDPDLKDPEDDDD